METRLTTTLLFLLSLMGCGGPANAPVLEPEPATEQPQSVALAESIEDATRLPGAVKDVLEPAGTQRLVQVSVVRMIERVVTGQPGFAIEVGIEHDDRTLETLTRWETDADGDIEAELCLPDVDACRVWARPCSPGWIQERMPARELEDGTLRIRITPRAGATARGMVQDSGGRKVASFQRLDRNGSAAYYGTQSCTDPSPELELHFRKSDFHRLRLRAPGLGTAVVEGLWLDVDDPPQDLRFEVEGGGRIAGKVVGPDGLPHVGMRLYLHEAVEEFDSRHVPAYWHSHVQAHGLRWDVVDTGPDGSFTFAGLALGNYVLRAETVGEPFFGRGLLNHAISTGSNDLRIVHRDHRVSVRFVDEEGDPVELDPTPRDMEHVLSHGFFGQQRDPWEPPTKLQVEVRKSDGHGQATEFQWFNPWTPTDVPGAWSFQVHGGSHYLIGVIAKGVPLTVREVHVPEGTSDQEIEVVIPEQVAPGTARIEFAVPEQGERMKRKYHALESYDCVLRAQPSALYLDRCKVMAPGAYEAELPPGTYTLDVEAEGQILMCGTGIEPEAYQTMPHPGRVEFRVRSGEVTTRTLSFRGRAGVVALVRMAGDDTTKKVSGRYGSRRDADLPRVQLVARTEGGAERVLMFQEEWMESTGDNPRIGTVKSSDVDWLHLGCKVASREDLDPGTWTFEARMDGHIGTPVTVVLDNGEVRFVELELRPE